MCPDPLDTQGLDKMLLDNTGEITITNDGATILQLLEVEHPAGKILVELAGLQDSEVGDGTTSVVILSAEMLKRAQSAYWEACTGVSRWGAPLTSPP